MKTDKLYWVMFRGIVSVRLYSMHFRLTLKSMHANQVAVRHDILYTLSEIMTVVGCFNFRVIKGSDQRI